MQLSCLLVRQPYATLIMYGKKRWEFRSYEVKKRGLIGIAASPSSILPSESNNLNCISNLMPKGCLLGTANLRTCFYITSKELVKAIGNEVKLMIHDKIVTTLDSPIGEPIEDVNHVINNKEWASWVWELNDINPIEKKIPIAKTSKSTWVEIDYDER